MQGTQNTSSREINKSEPELRLLQCAFKLRNLRVSNLLRPFPLIISKYIRDIHRKSVMIFQNNVLRMNLDVNNPQIIIMNEGYIHVDLWRIA